MAPTLRRILMVTLLLMALVPASAQTPRKRAAAPTTPTKNDFSINQLEHYMTDDGIAYIRPGLKLKINSVTIGADRKPVVDFNLTDNFDQPVDRLGKTTPGPVTLGFVLGWYSPATRQYTSYITRTETAAPPSPTPGVTATQATNDSGGTYVDLETGHGTYKFKNALPANFDQTKTHTLGLYAARNLTDQIGKQYLADIEYDFRPDGQKVTETWDKINLATSCNNCHNPLTAHGETGRSSPKTCALCHQPQTTDADTGNTVDFKVMIHKIHNGDSLPSVKNGKPYQIIGYGQGVNDFSTVAFPQDIRNCQNCHVGTNPNAAPAQSLAYLTNPSRAACGSCHDDVDWTTGANHAGGAQADDTACARCHIPDSGVEFDASVKGAHTNPLKSAQLKGISATIVSVSNLAPGKKPTVVFDINNGDGSAVDGSKLNAFSPMVGGPTSSYTTTIRESAVGKAVFDASKGTSTYTFNGALPADASGTWTVTADIYRNVSLKRGDGKADISVREAAFNPIQNVAVTGTVTPRRTSVVLSQCNSCHDQLALHGGQRRTTQECVICHNPKANDSAQRPVSAGQPESISLQRLVHRIHTGENLTQDFTVYGFGGSKNNFNDIRFPGDTRDCTKCHAGTSYTLPLPTGIDSVTTLRDYFSPQGPGTAACLGCHDNSDAAAHAYLNTTTFPGASIPSEACATCHGNGKDWDVAKVHAR